MKNVLRLFVGNLPFKTTADDLTAWFAGHGVTVINTKVATERDTGRSRGYGFTEVEIGDGEERDTVAGRLISELNGKQLDGRAMTIDAAKGTPRQ